MIGFQYKNGVYHVDDVPLPSIAQQFGTPVYVYSAKKLRQRCQNLKLALHDWLPEDRVRVFYACKANANLSILNLIHEEGLGVDIVTGGELKRVLRANIPGSHIVFSGVGKSHDDIMLALENNVHQINIESVPELHRINQIADNMNVTVDAVVRINPDITADTYDKIATGYRGTKFGIDHDMVRDVFEQARDLVHVRLMGLSIHIGSGILNLDNFRVAFEKLAECVTTLRAAGFAIHRLDLGGGLGLPYEPHQSMPNLDDYVRLIKDIILPLGTEIYLEPGKFIVGDSGVLLTKIEYVKKTAAKDFIILDAGMNDLIRPALYGAYHPIIPVNTDTGADTSHPPVDIVGPICETADLFAKDRPFPPCAEGDLVAIGFAGAYGATMASSYNAQALPPEILVDGGSVTLIRERWSVEDQMKLEKI